jgi:hypothetical protein
MWKAARGEERQERCRVTGAAPRAPSARIRQKNTSVTSVNNGSRISDDHPR